MISKKNDPILSMTAKEITDEAIKRSRQDEYSGTGRFNERKSEEPTRKRIVIEMTNNEFEILIKALFQLSNKHKVYAISCRNGYGKATSMEKEEMHKDIAEGIMDLTGRISEELM